MFNSYKHFLEPPEYNKIIGEDITFPHALKSILSKEKKSFPLSTDYKALKEFLLNLHGFV